MPQDRHVFPDLTVRENLLIGATSTGRWQRADAAERAAAGEDFARWLERFPALAARAGQRAGVLSGGEQMLAILPRRRWRGRG